MSKQPNTWLVPPLVFLLTFVIICGIDIYVPIAPQLASVFAVSDSYMKLTLLLGPLASCIAGIPFGYASDRWGRRPFLLLGIGLFILGALICGSCQGFAGFLIGRAIQSLGVGGLGVLCGAIFADLFTGVALARYMAIYGTLFPITFSLAPIIGAQIDAHFGWRAIFVFLVGLMTLTGLAFWRFFPETVKGDTELGPVLPRFRELCSSPWICLLVMTHSIPVTITALFTVSGPFLYQQAFGFTPIAFSFIQAVPVAAQFLGALACSQLVTRIGLAGCFHIGLRGAAAFAVASLAMLLGLIPPNPYLAVAMICIYSCVAPFVVTTAATLVLDHSPYDKGLTVSFISLVKNGVLSGVVTLGSVSSHGSLAPMMTWMLAVATMVIILVILSLRQLALRPSKT